MRRRPARPASPRCARRRRAVVLRAVPAPSGLARLFHPRCHRPPWRPRTDRSSHRRLDDRATRGWPLRDDGRCRRHQLDDRRLSSTSRAPNHAPISCATRSHDHTKCTTSSRPTVGSSSASTAAAPVRSDRFAGGVRIPRRSSTPSVPSTPRSGRRPRAFRGGP
jgi:hypothetical protein